MDLVQNLEQDGRKLYKTNPHYRHLANVMEHPEFRSFYNKYFQDWDMARTIIMFMKIYESIEKYSKIELTPFQKIAIADEMFQNSEKRQQICNGIREWCNNSQVMSRITTEVLFTDCTCEPASVTEPIALTNPVSPTSPNKPSTF